jgi:UTP--glucose-1-phosphate uridylyltransferase
VAGWLGSPTTSKELALPVRTAVLPLAGLGTRFLPATKVVPKELLPVVDRPALQYIVEECAAAGLEDVLFVTAAGKAAMEDHFDRRLDLEAALAEKGKDEDLEVIRSLAELVTIHSVRQGEPLGLGHAVLQGAGHVPADESFAVLLGDDLLGPGSAFLRRMIDAHERTGRPVLALMEVPEDQVHLYGVVATEPTDVDGEVLVTGLVEKPPREEAPSNLIVVGRYVLPGAIFEVLRSTPRGRGGEIQLTDALQTLAADEPLLGIVLDEPRYDTGDKLGFLQANVQLAAERDDLGPVFVEWLRSWLAEQDAAGAAAGAGAGQR